MGAAVGEQSKITLRGAANRRIAPHPNLWRLAPATAWSFRRGLVQGGAPKAGSTGPPTRAHPLVAALFGRMSYVDAQRAVTFLVVHPSFPSPCVRCKGRCATALRGGRTGTERALLRRCLCASICR